MQRRKTEGERRRNQLLCPACSAVFRLPSFVSAFIRRSLLECVQFCLSSGSLRTRREAGEDFLVQLLGLRVLTGLLQGLSGQEGGATGKLGVQVIYQSRPQEGQCRLVML